MTIGIGGTGPYGSIRSLLQQIQACNYEIYLIESGVKTGSISGLEKRIETSRAKIKKIRASLKKK